MAEKSHFVGFEAINISVAPIIITSVVAVEGEPEISRSRAEFQGHHAAPSAEAAVGIIELRGPHSLLRIDSVFGAFAEIVSANKVKVVLLADENSARFGRAFDAFADVFEALEGIV